LVCGGIVLTLLSAKSKLNQWLSITWSTVCREHWSDSSNWEIKLWHSMLGMHSIGYEYRPNFTFLRAFVNFFLYWESVQKHRYKWVKRTINYQNSRLYRSFTWHHLWSHIFQSTFSFLVYDRVSISSIHFMVRSKSQIFNFCPTIRVFSSFTSLWANPFSCINFRPETSVLFKSIFTKFVYLKKFYCAFYIKLGIN
jgi:hypothetical protein